MHVCGAVRGRSVLVNCCWGAVQRWQLGDKTWAPLVPEAAWEVGPGSEASAALALGRWVGGQYAGVSTYSAKLVLGAMGFGSVAALGLAALQWPKAGEQLAPPEDEEHGHGLAIWLHLC